MIALYHAFYIAMLTLVSRKGSKYEEKATVYKEK